MKKPRIKVPITMRALVQRINRKLAAADQLLRVSRGKVERAQFGRYYIRDSYGVYRAHLNIKKLGLELGVLKAWQCLAKPS